MGTTFADGHTYRIEGRVLLVACLQCGDPGIPVMGTRDWLDVDVALIHRAIEGARALDPRCHKCAEMIEGRRRMDALLNEEG